MIVVAWVCVPAVLIGWIAGFFDWQVFAGIIWGLIIIYTYPGMRRKRFLHMDPLTYFLALFQAGIGWVVVYFIGNITH